MKAQISKRILRSAYSKKTRVRQKFPTTTMTKQSFRDECDINKIMSKFQKTGAITHLQNNKSQYGFATSLDFTESMNIVAKAQTMFNELPSSIRSKFKNDPAAFLGFVQDESNADELVEMGLANAPPFVPDKEPDTDSQAPSDPAPNPPPPE